MFPGAGGAPWSLGFAAQALRDGGVRAEIRIYRWERSTMDLLAHLRELEANRAQARAVADELVEFRRGHPGEPIDLVGYSAGGGLALLVVEALPADLHLRNLVLCQAAVAPDHDLEPALRRLDGHLVNYYCPSDWFYLDLGTRAFGTVDRAYTPAAGKTGFNVVSAARDLDLRAKLVQHPWTREMLSTGHLGGHLGMLLYAWNRAHVAPLLVDEAPAHGPGPARL